MRPWSPFMRPTSWSISSRIRWYCSTSSRLGVAIWMNTQSSTAALGEQLRDGAEPYVDALGVVEPVDAEQ